MRYMKSGEGGGVEITRALRLYKAINNFNWRILDNGEPTIINRPCTPFRSSDLTIASPDLAILSSGRLISDHFPIITSIDNEPIKIASHPFKLKLSKASWTTFAGEVRNGLASCGTPDQSNYEEKYETFEKTVRSSLIAARARTPNSNKEKMELPSAL